MLYKFLSLPLLLLFLSGISSLFSDELPPVSDSEQEETEVIFISPSENAADAKVELPAELILPVLDEEPVRPGTTPGEEIVADAPAENRWEIPTDAPGIDANAEAVPALTQEPEVEKVSSGDSPKNEVLLPSFRARNDPGFPVASVALNEMMLDVTNGLNTRRVTSLYSQWTKYCDAVLRRTKGLATGIELNNRCRLSWYEHLYREPLNSVHEAESYSRFAYKCLSGNAADILVAVQDARLRFDIAASRNVPMVPLANSPDQAVAWLRQQLEVAAGSHQAFLAPLKATESQTLARELYSIFTTQSKNGHTIPNSIRGKALLDIVEKANFATLYDAAEALIPLTDSQFLAQLTAITPDRLETLEAVNHQSQRVYRLPTAAGCIYFGGWGNNVWDLGNLPDAACIVDLGGKDTYKEGVCNLSHPIMVVLDLGGDDDQYLGTQPGIQGGAILGVSLWYNQGGNNKYQARDVAQGSCIAGVGVLIDESGNDTYNGFTRAQGTALSGLGLLIDRAGNDDYHAAMLAQGLGHPRGWGVLADAAGDDHYYVGGYFSDSYPEHPGHDGWGQGIGAGIRGVAAGGIGLFLEGSGDDTYEYDYFAHGGGYWMGIGIARDFQGDDKRLGATLKAYHGGTRTENRWQRFCNGFGCHYALGYLFDDFGNDSYDGTIMGLGMGWDLAAGFLVDFNGDDSFLATGGLTQGAGAEGSIGILLEYAGNNSYHGRGQGYANTKLTYHKQSDCGANFSFVVDHGGQDSYGCGAENNTMTQRGTATGFVIDRPTQEELSQMATGGVPTDSGNKNANYLPVSQSRTAVPDTVAPPNQSRNERSGSWGLFRRN